MNRVVTARSLLFAHAGLGFDVIIVKEMSMYTLRYEYWNEQNNFNV